MTLARIAGMLVDRCSRAGRRARPGGRVPGHHHRHRGWLTGQWMSGGIDPDSVHPGYFLPTTAAGLIGANAAAQVHLHALAAASFGIGILSWALLGPVILTRLFTRPPLPPALVPAMAIELASPRSPGWRTSSFRTVVLAARQSWTIRLARSGRSR